MNTFSVDEYLSGSIEEPVIVHSPTKRLCWDHAAWNEEWCSNLERYMSKIWDEKGVPFVVMGMRKKEGHDFDCGTDPSVIVTAV